MGNHSFFKSKFNPYVSSFFFDTFITINRYFRRIIYFKDTHAFHAISFTWIGYQRRMFCEKKMTFYTLVRLLAAFKNRNSIAFCLPVFEMLTAICVSIVRKRFLQFAIRSFTLV